MPMQGHGDNVSLRGNPFCFEVSALRVEQSRHAEGGVKFLCIL